MEKSSVWDRPKEGAREMGTEKLAAEQVEGDLQEGGAGSHAVTGRNGGAGRSPGQKWTWGFGW